MVFLGVIPFLMPERESISLLDIFFSFLSRGRTSKWKIGAILGSSGSKETPRESTGDLPDLS